MKEKFEKIPEKLLLNLRSAEDEMFLHPGSVFTRDRTASGIKQTRVNYKKALSIGG